MKINLLLSPANKSWIIQKIAENLAACLNSLGVDAKVTEVVDEKADLIHHMSWIFANIKTRQPSTMFITHLDDTYKIRQVRNTLETTVKVGICMSRDCVRQLITHGCLQQSLHYISPAHDGSVTPRKTVIGITTRIYPDGRKREVLLQTVAQRMDLSDFEFRIFGQGWKPTIAYLTDAGANVQYFSESDDYRKDYESLLAAIPSFDYYLYLGLDEGSLGTLDALAAGVPTIITPQGFHLDIPGGITHPVLSADDLESVLRGISESKKARRQVVAGLTWKAYAEKHLELWRAVIREDQLPLRPMDLESINFDTRVLEQMRRELLRSNAVHPRRIVSAISHHPSLRPIRRALDRLRFGK